MDPFGANVNGASQRTLTKSIGTHVQLFQLNIEGVNPKLIISIMKPGWTEALSARYRPVAHLSCCYKVLERLLYNRISPMIDATIPWSRPGLEMAAAVLIKFCR